MHIQLYKCQNMQALCISQNKERYTNIKMFVQTAKGKYKIVAIIIIVTQDLN